MTGLRAATGLAVGIAASLTCLGAEPNQVLLKDFPPSPFALRAPSRPWPQPDPVIENLERDVKLQPVTTNQVEVVLIAEVENLRSRLLDLQAGVDAVDPYRRIYGQYIESTHEWVMKYHAREFWAANQFSKGADTNATKQRACNQIVDLVDMALYKELAANTNFSPLLKSLFEAMERKAPGSFGGSYARNDRLIGYHPDLPPKAARRFATYLSELENRYGLVLARLKEIQEQEEIPDEVVAGWMYGDLYRMLGGAAQTYVMLTTPEQVNSLREELRKKTFELERMQAKTQ